MSVIKELEIRGIRNFGDETGKAKLRLTKPLTLILGPNGTGKTTIIEALKYITSGEYPPDSDKGKSFVHEPKLTTGHTVRGNVKAKIVDKNGKLLTVSRTMQVARQQNKNLKFTALDNTISRRGPDGRETMLSSRCTDVNDSLLSHMGVSKAILNYVIFCHQEESTWPIEDGKKLKDRFDEIFDTSAFNKAMDSSTKFIKDLQSELKVLMAREKTWKTLVEEVQHHENTLKSAERRKQDNEDRHSQIAEQIKPIDKRITEISEKLHEHKELEGILERKNFNRDCLIEQVKNTKKHIKRLHTGTKEELQHMLSTHETGLSQKVGDRGKLDEELQNYRSNERELAKNLAEMRVRIGGLKQKKEAFKEKVLKRNELLNKSLKAWKMEEVQSVAEEEVKKYIEEIQEKMQDFEMEMQRRIREHDNDEKYLQRDLDESRSQRTKIEAEKTVKSKENAMVKQDISKIRRETAQTSADAEKLNSIERQLVDATNKLNKLEQDFDEEVFKNRISEKVAEKNKIEDKLLKLDEEIKSLHEQSAQQAELEINQKRLKSKEKEVIILKNKHEKDLSFVFNDDIPEDNIKLEFESKQKQFTKEQNHLAKVIEEEQKKLTTLETTIKLTNKEMEKISTELKGLKSQLGSACRGQEYEEVLALQKVRVKDLQDKRGLLASLQNMYKNYLKELEKKSCCPLCERGFKSGSEQKSLQTKLLEGIESNPEMLESCEKELKKEQIKYDALLQLKPLVERIEDLEQKQLNKLRRTKQDMEEQREKTSEDLNDLRMSLSEPEEKLKICKLISGDVALWDNFTSELNSLNRTINSQKREMSQSGKIGDRTMQEAQEDRENVQRLLSHVKTALEEEQDALRSKQEEIHRAKSKKMNVEAEALNIRTRLQKLQQSRDKMLELGEKADELEVEIRKLSEKYVVADAQVAKAEGELKKAKTQNRKEQEADREFKSINAALLRDLQNVQKEVSVYVKARIDENLAIEQTQMDQLITDEDKIKKKISELAEEIRAKEDEISGQESKKRDLENNLEIIEKQLDIDNLQKEIKELEEEMKTFAKKKLEREYVTISSDKEKLEKEQAEIKGKKHELEETIRDLKFRVLVQDKFKNARHNHRKERLNLVVQQEAIENLRAYITILDKSMIQFHSERMNTVNKIMANLWTLVYSGNDTSSIQIRVDETTKIGAGRRSYNYKLVQIKRGTEMDMKGRCSAGQKVLASIIIRMALAETFCGSCAVLALDEPTTNLDDEHATNLARTLSKVIQLRSRLQANFQLIVISHDEKFITNLSNLSGKQLFHELYRNDEGLTLIRQKNQEAFNPEESSDEEEEGEDNNYSRSKKRQADSSPPRNQAHKRRAYQ